MAAIILPRKHYTQPQGRVELAPEWAAREDPLVAFVASMGLREVGGQAITPFGSVATVADTDGMVLAASGSGNYVEFDRIVSPPAPVFTLICGFTVRSLAQTARLFLSHNFTNTSGVVFQVGAAGWIETTVGDAAGNGSGNRKSLLSENGTVVINRHYSAVSTWTGFGVGSLYVNGGKRSLALSGGATSYGQGVGNGQMHRLLSGGIAYYGNQEVGHLILLPYAVDESTAQSLSVNPWQMFRAEPTRIYTFPPVLTIPSLSSPGVIDITASSARPQVTLAY